MIACLVFACFPLERTGYLHVSLNTKRTLWFAAGALSQAAEEDDQRPKPGTPPPPVTVAQAVNWTSLDSPNAPQWRMKKTASKGQSSRVMQVGGNVRR